MAATPVDVLLASSQAALGQLQRDMQGYQEAFRQRDEELRALKGKIELLEAEYSRVHAEKSALQAQVDEQQRRHDEKQRRKRITIRVPVYMDPCQELQAPAQSKALRCFLTS